MDDSLKQLLEVFEYLLPERKQSLMENRDESAFHPRDEYIELQVGIPYAKLIAGQGQLVQAIAMHFGIDPEYILPTLGATGAIEAIRNHLMHLTPGGKFTALTVTPGYWRAREVLRGMGFGIIEVPLQAKGFTINEADIIALSQMKRPNLIYLSLPNNPTGAVFDPALIIRNIPSMTTMIVDMTLPGCGLDVQSALPMLYREFMGREHIFLVGSLSKSHAMAESRIGWAICTSSKDAMLLMQENRNVLPLPSVQKAIKCLGQEAVALEQIAHSQKLLRAGEKTNRFRIIRPEKRVESAYILLELQIDEEECKRLLAERRISVMWGSALGLTDRFIRLEMLTPANVQVFVDTINSYPM